MVDEIIRLAHSSVADLCIIPLQDYLGLGNEARINTPSTLGDNWKWRVTKDKLTDKVQKKIKIPMCGKVESLNAAMASGLLVYEARRQRQGVD